MKDLDNIPAPFGVNYRGSDSNPYVLSHRHHGAFDFADTEREARAKVAALHSQWTRLGGVAGVMLDDSYRLTLVLDRLCGRSSDRAFQLMRGNRTEYYASEGEARRAWCRLTGRPLATAKPRSLWSRMFGGTRESLENLHDSPRV